MPIRREKYQELTERMASLGVSESDFREHFTRSSGPGGQKTNKTATCVHLVHVPTGLSVKCQEERSQALNRFLARRILLDRIENRQKGILSEERRRWERIRRQKRRRSQRAKERMLQDKHHQSEKKRLRSSAPDDERR
ncbi:MAG TPA: peptide chain release factor-like protein [Syntrophales bacterium]|nr:peptide chain release factor-like protein [Syntrophales bacterium]